MFNDKNAGETIVNNVLTMFYQCFINVLSMYYNHYLNSK